MNFSKFYNFLVGGCIVALTTSCAIIDQTSRPSIFEDTNAIKLTETIEKLSKARPEIDPSLAANNLNELNKYIDDLSMWIYVERTIEPYETIDEAVNQDSIKILHRVIASYNSRNNASDGDAARLKYAIEFLLQKKADVNLLNDDGEDALGAFLKIGSNSSRTLDEYTRRFKYYSAEELEPMVKIFIENGADIKSKDTSGVSTFERIVDFAGIDFIKTLPESSIEINNKLNLAVKHNHFELIHYLLEKGAILDTATEEGKSAFIYAATTIDDFELFKKLVDKTSDINTMRVMKRSNATLTKNTLSSMIILGQNRSVQDQKNYINKIVFLLDKGIDVNERDWHNQNKENSLIVLALSNFRYEKAEIVCNKLIEKGANVNLESFNYTPLFRLLSKSFSYDIEPLFNLLIEQGADVNYVKDDKTPLDLATSHLNAQNEKIKNKAVKLSKILKSKGAKTFSELEK